MDRCACTIKIAEYVTLAQFKRLANSEWTPEITLRWLIYQYGLLMNSKSYPRGYGRRRQPTRIVDRCKTGMIWPFLKNLSA